MSGLSKYDQTQTFKNIKDRRHEYSQQWFCSLPEYNAWYTGARSNVLWLHGKPGAGKSYAASSIIDQLNTETKASAVAISYFFITSANEESMKVRTVIESLIAQQLKMQFTIPNHIESQINILMQSAASLQDLFELLRMTIKLSKIAYLIIDGLDECPEFDRNKILEFIAHYPQNTTSVCKIVISSRSDIDIMKGLSGALTGCTELALSDVRDRADINHYIEDQIQERIHKGTLVVRDPSLIDEIKTVLSQRSEGMYDIYLIRSAAMSCY